MPQSTDIKLFEDRNVRTHWDDMAEKWYFSVVDVVSILTDSVNPGAYWRKLKQRLKEEGNETVTNCHGLKMPAPDGKMRETDVADTEQVLRVIQSIPSKRAEPFKLWLARVGAQRVDEMIDPELAINRAVQSYRKIGYSESWINQRLKSIEVRKALTDEWDKSGVRKGKEYAELTDLMSRIWSGMTTREYKKFKGLRQENLRDNMTNTELVLNMLAEVAATDVSVSRNPKDFEESVDAAAEGAKAALAARRQMERSTGKSPITQLNAKSIGGARPKKINEIKSV
ncbi:MAG: Bro-N domain-containing protein [Rickettsiales bacterium]|jgi:hypothetical protein|nr:Bro-N domain-containing protein [Rickettsiales bacterium]